MFCKCIFLFVYNNHLNRIIILYLQTEMKEINFFFFCLFTYFDLIASVALKWLNFMQKNHIVFIMIGAEQIPIQCILDIPKNFIIFCFYFFHILIKNLIRREIRYVLAIFLDPKTLIDQFKWFAHLFLKDKFCYSPGTKTDSKQNSISEYVQIKWAWEK